jgi:hypothetical protein
MGEPDEAATWGGDVEEHLLWNLVEGSRRRHRTPGDERRAKELLVGVVEDNGGGKRGESAMAKKG